MSEGTLGDHIRHRRKSKEVDPLINEVSIFMQLIKERKHPLDLIRELLSNSGAKEVAASKIEISYTKDKEGHIFEVVDDGCGMNFTDNIDIPGRLDKFLGLGLSAIVGHEADEFAWKGLGSKLAYQSRRVEIETCPGHNHPLMEVKINEPWDTLSHRNIPRPRITEHPPEKKGTKIRVIGHPPHRKDEPFSFEEIKTFLQHRTFCGFTKNREMKPIVTLSVLGTTEEIEFGFPEIRDKDIASFQDKGVNLDVDTKTLFICMEPKRQKQMPIWIKGFITWDADKYNLSPRNLNTGLILSVKGIPYLNLDMEEYGVTTIRTARPGEKKTCLIVECDSIQDEMNISRSGLVDSPKTVELKQIVAKIFQRIERSEEFLKFRTLPEKGKIEVQSEILAEEKRKIEQVEQNWVVYDPPGSDKKPTVILREPVYEQDVNAIIWKLEALKALPFERFKSLGYIGAVKGPDMLVNFQEEKGSEPQRSTVIEVENNFYNYKQHGHHPAQYPKVICWDIPQSGRKAKLIKTSKPYKFTINMKDFQVHVFVLKQMPGIRIMSLEELKELGINQ